MFVQVIKGQVSDPAEVRSADEPVDAGSQARRHRLAGHDGGSHRRRNLHRARPFPVPGTRRSATANAPSKTSGGRKPHGCFSGDVTFQETEDVANLDGRRVRRGRLRPSDGGPRP